jgi:DeoR/GlpR family transcriptional regulator of sugar metabolism
MSIAIASAHNQTFNVRVCPGLFDAREGGVMGADTVEALSRYYAHFAIIGASSLTQEGPTEFIDGSAAVKRAMSSRATTTMLLIDQSKFGRQAFELICGYDEIDLLVSDGQPPEPVVEALRAASTELQIAV